MSSVLGKRDRSSDSESKIPRAKRPRRGEIYSDENAAPSATQIVCDGEQIEDSMDLDELSESASTPAKHGVSGGRIPLSPSKSIRQLRAVQIDGQSSNKTNTGLELTFKDENLAPIQNPTPQTPRHRDALSKKGPATPRHRVMLAGKPLTPRTPRTPSTPRGSLTTVYSLARQLFTRSMEPGRLVGREEERKELTDFVKAHLIKTSGGCTYVSGPPGTGKSAMVNEVAATFEVSDSLKKVYINCMSIKTSTDLYSNLLENLCGEEVMEGDEVKTLQGMFISRKKTKTSYLITLDEIDHILTLDLEILYKLFEWSLQKSSRLVLIGIANALDLTDRFLPRLKARNLKPELLPFLPYTSANIKTIIMTRLKSLVPAGSAIPDYVPFLHPAAIELCSRKVSSQTGDLRKAFDICRRAIDLVESETKQKHEQALKEEMLPESPSKRPLEENVNLSSPSAPSPRKAGKTKTLAQSLSSLTVETAPRASIGHVNKITSTTFGNGANQRLKTLNLQQKAALCALVALEKRKREAAANVMATPSKSKNAAPTIKALYDVYCMLCKQDAILHPLTSTEFRDVVGSLETLSLISAVDRRNGSFIGMTPSKRARKFGSGVGVGDEKRVASCVGEKEVAQAVEGLGAGILKSILSGQGMDY